MSMESDNTVENKKIKASNHESYNMMTLIAFVVPLVGFILGIVYLTKEKQLDRKLGEHLIAFSIFVSIMVGIVWFAYISLAAPSVPVPITQ